MGKVLLVDDEKNIRNGLRAIISRANTPFSEIQDCSGGADALKELSQTKFDLVITDIRMPHMDGFELIKAISDMEHKPYIIVLSGYSDFKYAQEAIKYGAKAYLLKPIDRNELIGLLGQIGDELAKKSDEKQRLNTLTAELLENQLKLLFLNEGAVPENIGRILNIIGLAAGNSCYSIAVLNSCEAYQSPEKKESNSILADCIKKLYAETYRTLFCCLDHNSNIVLKMGEEVNLSGILNNIAKTYGYACTAGISKEYNEVSGLYAAYHEAHEALKHAMIYPRKKMISFSDISTLSKDFAIPTRQLKTLVNMIDTERGSDINRSFHGIFNEIEIKANHVSYLEKLASSLKSEIINYLMEYIPHKTEFIKEQESIFPDIYRFGDISEYLHCTYNYILNINSFLLMSKKIYDGSEIDGAIRFLQENFQKDLTMAEVANRISLNYSYFSILFKEKTGMNFIDYLKNLRVEKAKELIKNTDYKIAKISEMVGYHNPKHFSTTFRMITGISPKEYKEKCLLK